MNNATHYSQLLEIQDRITRDLRFVTNSDCRVKVGVAVSEYIDPSRLLELALKMATNLQEIHQIASAGPVLGTTGADELEAISEIAADSRPTAATLTRKSGAEQDANDTES